MKKIFISHNQDFAPARAIKELINMLGAYGVLVEDEHGAESPDKKSHRLLTESDGFLAVCTCDMKDEKGNISTKPNVALEIKAWQDLRKTENMVVIKEDGCVIPALLGNPTYSGRFSGGDILGAVSRALSELQLMKLIPYKDRSLSPKTNSTITLSDKEISILKFLAQRPDTKAFEQEIKTGCSFGVAEWNAAVHKLETKLEYLDSTNFTRGRLFWLLPAGFDFLLK